MQKTESGKNSKRGGQCGEKFQESSHMRDDQERLKIRRHLGWALT